MAQNRPPPGLTAALGNQSLQRLLATGVIQAKLRVGRPTDPYEREADRVADRVMRMKGPPCACGGECPACRDRAPPRIPRSAPAAGSASVPATPLQRLGGGRPLDAGARALFEPRFGADFSQVRVHTDASAAESARSLQARAYTVGSHIVFDRDGYDAGSPAGRRLLAHELAHVSQQRGTAGAIQRAVRETPQAHPQQGAQVCMVHVHGDERNALEVARGMHRDFCANLVHLNNTGRCISFDTPALRDCSADPNRIFSSDRVTLGNAFTGACPCPAGKRSRAVGELRQFHDQQLAPAIGRCRGGSGTGLAGTLPTVALHNNTRNEDTPRGLSIESYMGTDPRTGRPGGEFGATETDPTRLGGAPNPSLSPLAASSDPHDFRDVDNFLLVTQAGDFSALRGQFNIVLQSTSPADDGSLSVALAGERYVNVEAQNKPFTGATDPFFITNRQMAEAVFSQLGVGRQPCSLERTTGGGPIPEEGREEPASLLDQIIDWLRRLLREIGRVLDALERMPPPLPREAAPASLPAHCRTFGNHADLDARKSHWDGVIASMPVADVVSWIVGVSAPPSAAAREAGRQKDCLLHAISRAARRRGSGISLPAGGHTQSGRRGFVRQEAIWNRKFDFLHPQQGPFGRITHAARQTCGSLLSAAEREWNPGEPRHRACWGVAPLPVTTAPAMPAGARALDDDERQFEILQTSSAPGISRHHAGTDFDLFDPNMDPAQWETGGSFADEYSWLRRNASTYGFIQSFTATSTFMRLGYIEERWHWSYFPIAHALLEFARAHQGDIERELLTRWGANPQFSFIRRHWREYMFNVSERGVF